MTEEEIIEATKPITEMLLLISQAEVARDDGAKVAKGETRIFLEEFDDLKTLEAWVGQRITEIRTRLRQGLVLVDD